MSGVLTDTTTTSVDTVWSIVAISVLGYLLYVLPLMGVFVKAGRSWFAAVVPIYNAYVLLRIVGRPGWWLVLYLIPLVNIIIAVIVYYDLARSFGHGGGFTVGLVLLNWIFLMILWLGSSTYHGPAAAPAQPVPSTA